MTPFDRLFRTTAVKLSLVYLVLTALIATALLGTIVYQTRQILQEQIEAALDAEIAALDGVYRASGLVGLLRAVEARALASGPSIYLVTTPLGEPVAGNVATIDASSLNRSQRARATYTREDSDGDAREALVQVFVMPGGVRLLVGRDLGDEVRVRDLVIRAGLTAAAAVLILGVAGGWFMARRIAVRIDAMSATSRDIMAGDLTRRLPLAGSGDEFDRLAESVNAALARIEALMRGLKGVSDDIAHDLKTPLTRLRARVEDTLRSGAAPDHMRATLDKTLEDTDGLIRTFDALLMIARTEGGAGKDGFVALDLAVVAAGVVELYEALAEEKGLSLRLDAPAPVPLRGHRELLAQALANLVDNAIKHAPDGAITVSVRQAQDMALATVTDGGPGIPEADRERVLERFVRLETSRSRPGAGLGLSLVAAVARLHDGTIRFEDAQPGLRAVLTLPAADQRP